jgi:hypothetical protein
VSPIRQRPGPKIAGTDLDQIEGNERRRHHNLAGWRGIGQEVEAGDELLVEDGDFTVEDGAAGWEPGDGAGDVGEALGMVLPGPAHLSDGRGQHVDPTTCDQPSARARHSGVQHTEPDGAATLTIEHAATRLGVSTTTVRRLITTGRLPATQPVPYAPWAIAPDQLRAETVQQAVAAVKAGRKLPQTAPETQLTLTNARI